MFENESWKNSSSISNIFILVEAVVSYYYFHLYQLTTFLVKNKEHEGFITKMAGGSLILQRTLYSNEAKV